MRSVMPNRIYRGHEPPTFFDHVLAHPWELTVAAFSALAGVLAVIAVAGGAVVSPSIERLPDALAIAIGFMLAVGGALTARGLFDSHEDLMVGFGWERAGLVLTGCAWTVYAAVVVIAYPASILSWGLGATFALGAGLRLAATFADQRRLERAIRETS